MASDCMKCRYGLAHFWHDDGTRTDRSDHQDTSSSGEALTTAFGFSAPKRNVRHFVWHCMAYMKPWACQKTRESVMYAKHHAECGWAEMLGDNGARATGD